MGPKLNLEFLTPEECEKIIEVIQKDLVLQHLEQQRIWKINEEVSDNSELCKILSKQNSFNVNYCLYCFLKFRLIFRKRVVCKICEYNFCQSCAVFDAVRDGYVCSFCTKKKQCERQSLEWFYSRVRSKFKRSGSSKVIRCLCLRNSSSAAMISKSMDATQSPRILSSCDSLDKPYSCDKLRQNHSMEEKEGDDGIRSLDRLTERLVEIQDSCAKTSGCMKQQVSDLVTMEKSLTDMDDLLNSVDESFLGDHHLAGENSCHGHRYQDSNETMLNLAANQISDITSVAAGLLEKTLLKANEIAGNFDESDEDTNDIEEYIFPTGSDNVIGQVEEVENFVESGIRKSEHQSNVGSVDDDDDWENDENTLKSIEKDVYKATSRTYILEEKITDLESEITAEKKDSLKMNIFDNKVAVLAVEVTSNENDVKTIQHRVASITTE